MKKINQFISLSVLSLLLAPKGSFAACSASATSVALCTTPSGTSVSGIITKIIGWLTSFLGALAVLFIIWGGVQYLTAAGNEKQAESAKKTLTYAIIGLIIILLARVIVVLIGNTASDLLRS